MLTLAIALLALISVGWVGIHNLTQAQQRFEYVQTNIMPSVSTLSDIQNSLSRARRLSYRTLVSAYSGNTSQIAQRMSAEDAITDKLLATYEKDDISDADDRKFLDNDRVAIAEYRASRNSFLEKLRANDMSGATAALLDGGAVTNGALKIDDVLGKHIAYNQKLSEDVRTENNLAYDHSFWVTIVSVAAAFVTAGSMGLQLFRLITSGLNRMQRTFQHVSRTLDLTNKAHVERLDEIGLTAAAFNTLLARVAEVVGTARMSAGSVSVASKQIAAGNVDLSARTEEQAASLEETAASMEELTATVRQNTESARQASTLALNATETSEKGNQVVERMVVTMSEITASSSKIAEITALIEGIAFQTNILALNAAVEAARAGEQGRGFAVVAAEVRTLAQRSSAAAKEIKDLIEKSVATIDRGASEATEVGRTTMEAKHAVRRVADIIGEIAAASEEQGRGIEQVNQAVGQMDEVTQQNAALVEEAAAAAQSLEEQAAKLNEVVSVFTVAYSATTLDVHKSVPLRSAAKHVPVSGRPPKAQTQESLLRPAAVAGLSTATSATGSWDAF